VGIIEAAERSGSLVTARRAGEQGRIVFAVPGSPLDPRAAGTNRLIKEGAVMVTSPEDILTELQPMLEPPPAPAMTVAEVDQEPAPMEVDESGRTRVEAALGKAPVTTDEIVRFTGLAPAAVHLILLELDFAGRIERHRDGSISLV